MNKLGIVLTIVALLLLADVIHQLLLGVQKPSKAGNNAINSGGMPTQQ